MYLPGARTHLLERQRGAFGCQLVEADLSRQTLTARACATDVIRFAQELISIRQGMAAAQLGNHLKERSRSLTNDRRTTVVEMDHRRTPGTFRRHE